MLHSNSMWRSFGCLRASWFDMPKSTWTLSILNNYNHNNYDDDDDNDDDDDPLLFMFFPVGEGLLWKSVQS